LTMEHMYIQMEINMLASFPPIYKYTIKSIAYDN